MVNNNGIPKTEMVYELKSEIPSYEEFLKNYENDKRVKNSYESEINSYGDLEKGYGPCHRYCDGPNPNCTCYVGEEYVAVYLVCPVPKNVYPTYCNDTTAGQWYHSNCGGSMYINVDLNMKCMKPGCGKDGHMRNWKFACSSHPGIYDWASKKEFSNALLTLTNLWSDKNEVIGDMVRDMARNLRGQKLHYA